MWLLDEFVGRVWAADPISVTAFLAGIFLVLAASGAVSGAKYGSFSLPSPEGRRSKAAWMAVGILLVLASATYSLTRPVYKPFVSVRQIYTGNDAVQIVADGEDVFLLTRRGNIFRISDKGPELTYDETETRQIAAAGGVLYILKNNGNVWLRQSIFKNRFQISDPGTGSKQIVPAGETLYVLKNNGNIWKSVTTDPRPSQFMRVDDGTNTKMMASAGSVLYILKEDGTVFQYLPVQQGTFYEIIPKNGDRLNAELIEADGGTLYFIRNDGTTWRYKDGSTSLVEKETTKRIDALGGVLYILTSNGRVVRYASPRDREELTAIGDGNCEIAAYGHDLFAIKRDGSAWLYNEAILKR